MSFHSDCLRPTFVLQIILINTKSAAHGQERENRVPPQVAFARLL